jgi:hypothetical protein
MLIFKKLFFVGIINLQNHKALWNIKKHENLEWGELGNNWITILTFKSSIEEHSKLKIGYGHH